MHAALETVNAGERSRHLSLYGRRIRKMAVIRTICIYSPPKLNLRIYHYKEFIWCAAQNCVACDGSWDCQSFYIPYRFSFAFRAFSSAFFLVFCLVGHILLQLPQAVFSKFWYGIVFGIWVLCLFLQLQ